jgi:RHH-type transcriptional regulator, rel operon repressor / antitoxin RelB
MNTTTLIVRISPQQKSRLARIGKTTRRSVSFLGGEAIDNYIALQEWQVAGINASIDDFEKNRKAVPHAEMVRWIESWGTKNELPPPKARTIKKVWK